MDTVLAIVAVVLALWAWRLAQRARLLARHSRLIDVTQAELLVWQGELEAAHRQMHAQHAHVFAVVNDARQGQEEAMLALGKRLAVIVGEVDEESGRRLREVTMQQVSRMAADRVIGVAKRTA